MFSFCLSKPQAWYIIAARSAVYIIKGGLPPLYLITRQRASSGKTNYMLFESVVTNTIYYGFAFILYATNVWTPTLTGIALLFGIGNAFDSIVSFVAYAFLLKKEKINLLKVE